MDNEPKILEGGESTYRNGGGSMCGGVISQSYFDKYVADNGDPYGIMMAFVMDDENFEVYKKYKEAGMHKNAKQIFDACARSMI